MPVLSSCRDNPEVPGSNMRITAAGFFSEEEEEEVPPAQTVGQPKPEGQEPERKAGKCHFLASEETKEQENIADQQDLGATAQKKQNGQPRIQYVLQSITPLILNNLIGPNTLNVIERASSPLSKSPKYLNSISIRCQRSPGKSTAIRYLTISTTVSTRRRSDAFKKWLSIVHPNSRLTTKRALASRKGLKTRKYTTRSLISTSLMSMGVLANLLTISTSR